MRCKNVQKEMVLDPRAGRLSPRVRTHLARCPECREVQALYARIDRTLREQPSWHPPPGFGERVGRQGLMVRRSAPSTVGGRVRLEPGDFSGPVTLGAVTAVLSMIVLRDPDPLAVARVAAVLALGLSGWLTWRTLRA